MGLVDRLDFRPHSKQEAQPKQAKDKKGHKKWADIDRYLVDVLIPSDPALTPHFIQAKRPGWRPSMSRPIRASC